MLGRGFVIACFYEIYLAVVKAYIIAQSVEFTHEMLVILLYKRTGLAGEDHGHLDFLALLCKVQYRNKYRVGKFMVIFKKVNAFSVFIYRSFQILCKAYRSNKMLHKYHSFPLSAFSRLSSARFISLVTFLGVNVFG